MSPGPSSAVVAPFLKAAACGALAILAATSAFAGAETPTRTYALTPADDALLDQIERAGFSYFSEQANPANGLVRDRARADGSPSEGKASISAEGFAFSAWVIAAERGWVDRAAAAEQVRRSLAFLVRRVDRPHGFFHHFLEMDSGARAWKCEVSSIDTSLLLAGALVAREYFDTPAIRNLVDELLADVDWAWFRNDGELVALGWHDETGFSRYRWNKYSEHLLMSFLALGTSPHPVEAAYWRSWARAPLGRYGAWVYLQEPPLFVHQFPQAYLDFRDRRDGFADYFRNSRLATLAQRQFSVDLRSEFPAWGENLWGLSASDSATGYKAWGGPPRTTKYNALDGTIVPYAAAGSLPFAPAETLAVLHHLKDTYGDRIWKRYGFVDAFNPGTGWVNSDVIGIDQGISVVQAENLRTGLIQRLFMQAPEVRAALAQSGLLSTRRALTAAETSQARELAAAAWLSLAHEPATPGLQLSAILSARALGLLNPADASEQARRLLAAPAESAELATQLGAALVAARQALPDLAPAITSRLGQIPWRTLAPASKSLGSTARLTTFLQVATGARPASAWTELDRSTVAADGVQVLAPALPTEQVLPGLWLDESALLSGASASQLAYGRLTAKSAAVPADAADFVLALEHFPVEALSRRPLGLAPGTENPTTRAILLVTLANLLTSDGPRHAFQQDPQVRAARAEIPEFGEAAFGPNTSVIAQRELAPPRPVAPSRTATAAATTAARQSWDWQTLAGLEFKDSDADVRPGDAPLEMRFAFTWDDSALGFHAEVIDTPKGFDVPPERDRAVELFIDAAHDGLVWGGAADFQFSFTRDGATGENFHHVPVHATIHRNAQGYTVEASIPWSALGIQPHAGLELGVSPAVLSAGTREWDASLKLNWSYTKDTETTHRLGRLRLL